MLGVDTYRHGLCLVVIVRLGVSLLVHWVGWRRLNAVAVFWVVKPHLRAIYEVEYLGYGDIYPAFARSVGNRRRSRPSSTAEISYMGLGVQCYCWA